MQIERCKKKESDTIRERENVCVYVTKSNKY